MKVSGLGEFGLIDVLAELVEAEGKQGEAWQNLYLGIGDDAAAWRCSNGYQLATIDALVQDVHFKLSLTSWEDLGWKSLAVNISDIAAMGGSPRYALISLALPPETEVADIVYFYQGMLSLAREFDVAIVGGNISRSPIVVINIAVYGDVPGPTPRLLTRSAVELGDKVAVTGNLGTSAAGLEMLLQGLHYDIDTESTLKRAFLKPVPRVKEGRILASSGVRAGIDISDGLVSDLTHICQASALGARIQTEKVPVADCVRTHFPGTALQKALSGGEDYELLFTAPRAVIENVSSLLEPVGCPVTVIGEMVADTEAKVVLLDSDGRSVRLAESGWDHFAKGEA
jgi:thiamine-monophosphate kinase